MVISFLGNGPPNNAQACGAVAVILRPSAHAKAPILSPRMKQNERNTTLCHCVTHTSTMMYAARKRTHTFEESNRKTTPHLPELCRTPARRLRFLRPRVM